MVTIDPQLLLSTNSNPYMAFLLALLLLTLDDIERSTQGQRNLNGLYFRYGAQ